MIMKYNTITKTLFFITLSLGLCLNSHAQKQLIFDTDFGGDADDLGALAMLNHFQNKKEIELMAVMCWNTEKYAVSAIDAVNTFYGNPDIPIGFRSGDIQVTDWNHTKILADNLPHNASHETVPETTALYRKLLSQSQDKSITIITVGPLLNIKKLIDSKADEYTALDGLALIKAKVKEFVIMGGQFPVGERREWNFDGNMPGVTQYVLDQLKVPITFLGYEIGVNLKTGEVFNELEKTSPLYLGFYHFSKYAPWMKHQYGGAIYDNATYDQTAVLYAVRNGIDEYWKRVDNGVCVPDAEGRNIWEPSKGSQQSYLVLNWPKAKMESELEKFMLGNF